MPAIYLVKLTRAAVAGWLVALLACTQHEEAKTAGMRTLPFEGVFVPRHSLALQRTADAPLIEVRGAAVLGSRVVVLDLASADAKLYDRKTGRLVAAVGKPGDEFGSFRAPSAVAALPDNKFAIWDSRRGILSIGDSLGGVSAEVPVPSGFYSGLVAVPSERRFLLTGRQFKVNPDAPRAEIHEFGMEGQLLRSYGETQKPRSEWDAQFLAVFGAPWNGELLVGSINSNSVRRYNPVTQKSRSFRVGDGWYSPFEYPSDKLLHKKDSSAMSRMTTWIRKQRMMNGVFASSDGVIIGRFQAFDGKGNRYYYYAVGDTLGRTYAVAGPTRALVVWAKADTVFWLWPRKDSTAILAEGFVSPRVLPATTPGLLHAR